jgi:hypothetical protein
MVPNVRVEIEKQVGRVRRRLLLRELIGLGIAWSVAAIAVTTVWLLVEPYIWRDAPNWLRWVVLGGSLGIGTIVATTMAIIRRPSATKSALWLDDAFGLRERVTTSLALSGEDAATSAGQAVLADALSQVKGLRVGKRFPIRIGRSGWLVPSAATALTLVALFYTPEMPTAQGTTEGKALASADKVALEKKLDAIIKPKRDPMADPNRVKSEDLKKLEAKLDEIARQPRDTTKQLRERVKEMTPLEDEVKKLERERGEKSRLLQQQLQMKDQLMPNDGSQQDGPAKDFMKALSDGDLDSAREQLDKLAKKMAKDELTEQDKQQLAKQLNNLQKKMNDLAVQKNKEETLKKLGENGKLDPEALEREMTQLRQENEKLKDLQKLANKINQCQQCMKAGDNAGAQKAMGAAADQISEMARDDKELNDLRDALQSMKDTREAMAKAVDDIEPGPNGNGGDAEGGQQGINPGGRPSNSDFANNGGLGRGQRADGDQGKIRPYDAKQNGQFNAKGQKVFDGFVPGQAFKKKAGVDLATDIKQAAQEAPEAIENQRIPKAARDMAKGYFKNLGGQAEGDKKDEKKEEKKD